MKTQTTQTYSAIISHTPSFFFPQNLLTGRCTWQIFSLLPTAVLAAAAAQSPWQPPLAPWMETAAPAVSGTVRTSSASFQDRPSIITSTGNCPRRASVTSSPRPTPHAWPPPTCKPLMQPKRRDSWKRLICHYPSIDKEVIIHWLLTTRADLISESVLLGCCLLTDWAVCAWISPERPLGGSIMTRIVFLSTFIFLTFIHRVSSFICTNYDSYGEK